MTPNGEFARWQGDMVWHNANILALQAQRDAGAKAVIHELRDAFKDTCEIGTNHLNSELDRLENK